MVALPGLTAFLAVSAGASATTAFFMTLAASTIAGVLSAQTTAKIVHGRNASKKELIIGGILGFGTGLFTATQVINKMSSAKSLPLRDKVILETRTQAGGATISGDYPGNSKLK